MGDGFSTGMVATIARMIGERDEKNASVFSTTGTVILVILGLLLTPILLLGAPYIFRFMRLPFDLIDTAWEYYSVFISFVPAIFAFLALSASFRARGDTKTPMLFTTKIYPLPHLYGTMFVTGLGSQTINHAEDNARAAKRLRGVAA